MYSLKKISFLLFLLMISSCTKKEDPKEEVIQLTCSGTEESKNESNDPRKPSFELKTQKSIVYKFTKRKVNKPLWPVASFTPLLIKVAEAA